MTLVVVSDIALVLFLAMGRNVLSKIDSNMSGLLIFHIVLAIAVVIGYVFAALWGYKLAKGEERYRPNMKILDKIILPARILVFLTALLLKIL
jgi:heme/copper-type cytochrome/quinol oxidase subunit 2